MNAGWIVLLVCAGGYVALALYGKYRTIKQQFQEARDEQARASGSSPDEPEEPEGPAQSHS
jgi:cytochrome c-type biogenesis protein CcmH/NrfG